MLEKNEGCRRRPVWIAYLSLAGCLLLASLGRCNDPSCSRPAATSADGSAAKRADGAAAADGGTGDDASQDLALDGTVRMLADQRSDAPKDPWTEPEITHLLALAHESTAAEARVLPLSISGEGLVLGKEKPWKATPHASMRGHMSFVVSHGGGDGYAAVQSTTDGFAVAWSEVENPSIFHPVEVGKTAPAALLVVGNTVLIGIANTLGQIDFSQSEPSYVRLHERKEMTYKAYDLFARAGDWVIAIDDFIRPIYADSLRVDVGGHARHVVGFEMPGAVNGSYRHAVLHAAGEETGTLYAVVPYSIMSGSGQDLARLPLEGSMTTFGNELTLNITEHPNVLEEHVHGATPKPTKLVAGSEMTSWTGLALLEEEGGRLAVLLAAGSRGLFVLPPETGPGSKASVVSLGADCYDVKVAGARVFALVEGSVVELRRKGEGLAEVGRTQIPSIFRRWAR